MELLTDGSGQTNRNSRPFEREPKAKKKRGRPKIYVDLRQLRALAAMQCKPAEIAAVLGISFGEFENRRIGRGEDKDFKLAYDEGRAEGCASLRRAQWKTALGTEKIPGNPHMQIFLGKQYLEQREVFDMPNEADRELDSLWQLKDILLQRGPTMPIMKPAGPTIDVKAETAQPEGQPILNNQSGEPDGEK